MRAKIEIEFTKIQNIELTEELLKKDPKILESTKKTVEKLSEMINEYFMKYKINTKIRYDVK